MQTLNRRALAYVVSISLITSPASANGLTELLSNTAIAVKNWSKTKANNGLLKVKSATKRGAKAEAEVAPEANASLHLAQKFVDQIEKDSGGLFRSLSKRVSANLYSKTLGRDSAVSKLITNLTSSSSEGAALEGLEGLGKTQHLIGLQERINLGDVPEALKNAQIIQVATDNFIVNSIDSLGRQVEKLTNSFGQETKTVIVHFENIGRYVPEHESIKFDEVTEVIRRKFAEKNIQVKFVIEGTKSELDKLATKSALAKTLKRQVVEELSIPMQKKIVEAYAKRVGDETGYYATPEAQEKLMTYARIHYSDLGMPTAANKLLDDTIANKISLLNKSDSVLSSITSKLHKKKEILEAEFEKAHSIVEAAEASGKANGVVYARQRLKTIPNESTALETEIEHLTAKYKRFETLRTKLKELTATAESAKKLGKETDAATKKEIASTLKEINTVSTEDIALQIHSDLGVSLDELLIEFRPLALEESLQVYKSKIFGQSHLVEAVAELGQRIRAAFRNKNKPAASIFLLGPPGAGKTELANTAALVEYGSYDNMHRLNMADFAEKHSASGITGTTPGYVGFGEGGDLVSNVISKPEAVVLLDEIERAHPDIVNDKFLALLTTGKMSNGAGKVADFSKTMVIVTSNKGQHFTSAATRKEIEEYLIAEGFKPEFLDRFDKIMVADPIDKSIWGHIFGKYVQKLNADELAQTFNHVEVSPKAIAKILGHAESEVGAKESARVVERASEKLLADINNLMANKFYKTAQDEVVEVAVHPGDLIHIDWDDVAGLTFKVAE